MRFHIALQDGFQNDAVSIYVNDRQVYQASNVTTDLRISRADAIDVQVEQQVIQVKVDVPSRNKGGKLSVNIRKTPYLAVSIGDDSSLKLEPSSVPFVYM